MAFVVVEPLTAAFAPFDGGVAGALGGIGCIGSGVVIGAGGGVGGICWPSPAGIGISGGNGSVTGGVGFEGSGIELGFAGSSVSPGIGCDPAGAGGIV